MVQNRYQLTSCQKRLWIEWKKDPTSSSYNTVFQFKLLGEIKHKILERSLNYLTQRHESLRTYFSEESDCEYQVILPELQAKVEEYDLTNYDCNTAWIKAREILKDHLMSAFNIKKAPLFRYLLIRISKDEHLFGLAWHHIIIDATSVKILLKELSDIYNQIIKYDRVDLEPVEIHVQDILYDEKERFSLDNLEEKLTYWENRLSKAEFIVNLPIQGKIENQSKSIRNHIILNENITKSINKFIGNNHTTLFVMLASLLKTLFYHYTRQEDITIGYASNIRSRRMREAVGFFVNNLPLRTKFSAHMTFKDLVVEIEKERNVDRMYQDTPIIELIKALRNNSKEMEFMSNVWINQFTTFGFNLDFEKIACEIIPITLVDTQSDLIILYEQSNNIVLEFEFNTSKFNNQFIKNFLQSFQVLIDKTINNPDAIIGSINVLSPKVRNRLLKKWNNTQVSYSVEKTIHEWFQVQAKKTPNNVAVIFENKQLTYSELNHSSDQFAHYLRSNGVGQETLVAISMERCLELVVCLLGILKAGGAYVPLDPSYPSQRLQFMINDSGAAILITTSEFIRNFINYNGHALLVDQEWNKILKVKICNQRYLTSNTNLAYVIYTSGSTGTPKGVAIEHRSLINHMAWMLNNYEFNDCDRILQKTPISFDASVWEFYLPLLKGAVLVVAPRDSHKSPHQLIQSINQYSINTIQIVPSMLKAMLEEDEIQNCTSLKNLFLGGEQLDASLVKELVNYLPHVNLHNLYGPTEATIDTIVYTYDKTKNYTSSIPIGKPISNTKIYLLNDFLQLAPINASGEIYISGVSLAREYLNRPESTQEKFISNPYAEGHENSHIYKTGDLARYDFEGNIEFLGRVDEQTKIRGYRIELGEIESVLKMCGDVKDAKVTIKEESTSDKNLVAYIVPGEFNPSILELQEFLMEKLPAYMIPNTFVFIESFPYLPNGKIDIKTLRSFEENTLIEDNYVPPTSEIEKKLANIWINLLKKDKIGVRDNFFLHGGHSLLATQLLSRINRDFETEISLRQIFDFPTIYHLAKLISNSHKASLIPPFKSISRPIGIPLSYAQQRLWFLEQLLPLSSLYNVPLAFRLHGNLNKTALQKSFDMLLKRHEILRTRIGIINGKAIQVITSEMHFPLEVFELNNSSSQEQKIYDYINDELRKPFDLYNDLLIRGKLICLGVEEYILLITKHHIITDWWSMDVFYNDLNILYRAYVTETPIDLQELPIQYADFAICQRNWLNGEVLEKQLVYWKNALKGVPEFLNLPIDRPRIKSQNYQGTVHYSHISKVLLEKIKSIGENNDATLFITLLTAFQILLHRYSNQETIIVGSPVANRHYPEIENLIGFFVNLLVFKADFHDDPTFEELLKQVREFALDAYAHQDLPFEQLIDHLNIKRHLNRHPLFQVLFDFKNIGGSSLILEGLKIKDISMNSQVAKFDLTLFIQEKDGGLELKFEYATSLFMENTISRIAKHFECILESVSKNPNLPINKLPLLTKEENLLICQWNNTHLKYSINLKVHQLFENQAALTPESIAISFEDKVLNYHELNEKSKQFASYLQTLGVNPEIRVAVCMEHSLNLIIALLGILRAGGAFLPLDPSYPDERLKFMLNDSGISILITEERLSDKFSDFFGINIDLDSDWHEISKSNTSTLINYSNLQDLAYIIYTSGSTGNPKGVMVEHHSLTNYLIWCKTAYPISVGSGALFHTSIAFDLSITTLFVPLITGKTVYMNAKKKGIDCLIYGMERLKNLTFVKLTPTHLKLLRQNPSFSNLIQGTNAIILGGEELLADDIIACQKNSPNIDIFNEYGPTEATVGCSLFKVESTVLENKVIPIGRPIANTKIYILNSELQPVPIGVVGELYIEGMGVARGYLNAQDLNRNKFIKNPFNNDVNSKLYKTGDLGRYLIDGNIEFIGRLDNQVKLKGYRIELGEIESEICKIEWVHQAAVILKKDSSDHQFLVAYIVIRENISERENLQSGPAIQRILSKNLPHYMVPNIFSFILEMPLTVNGKIDKNELYNLAVNKNTAINMYVAPVTEMEKKLVSIWSQVLQQDNIGIYDNFFEIGGDSIISIQLVSKARQHGIGINIEQIFENPTIESLALVTTTSDANISVSYDNKRHVGHIQYIKNTLKQKDVEEIFNLSYMQEGLLFRHLYEKNSDVYMIQSIYELNHICKPDTLYHTWKLLIERHSILRAGFLWENIESPIQFILNALTLPWEVCDWSDIPKRQKEIQFKKFLQDDRKAVFDLTKPPLFRLKLIRFSDSQYYLVWTIHHILIDGWSGPLIIKDVLKIYNKLIEGEDPISNKVPSYRSYINWLDAQDLVKAQTYWRDYLTGFNEPSYLNFEKSVSPLIKDDIHQSPICEYRKSLSKSQTNKIKQFSKDHHFTLNTIVQCAWSMLISYYTHLNDIVFGITVSGRSIELNGIDEMVGLFINTLPVRIKLLETDTILFLLKRLQQNTLLAHQYAYAPLVKIQACSDLGKSQALFDHVLAFENYPINYQDNESQKSLGFKKVNGIEKTEYALTLAVLPGEQLSFIVSYCENKFDKASIVQLVNHLQNFLYLVINDPDKKVGEISPLSREESQLFIEWNNTEKKFPDNKCLHQLFELQVEKTPNEIAVIFNDECLSYSELNKKSNQLANLLRQFGVDAEIPVAISIERSLDLIISVLGVLKAGGGYVPLDIDYPSERLHYILSDSHAPVLITSSKLAGNFTYYSGRIINIDRDKDAIEQQSCDNLLCKVNAQSLVYIIYTSGSTGKPKGIVNLHQGIVNRITWMQDVFNLENNDRVLHKTAFGFDVSVWELFWPLTVGAKLLIAPPGIHQDPYSLSLLIQREQITVIHFVPSMLKMFLMEEKVENCTSLKFVFSSGEELSYELMRNFLNKLNTKLYNLYGPTEAAIDVTYWDCSLSLKMPKVPIGRPIANTKIYILDKYLRQMPVGIPGELCIGGVNLARCYLNLNNLTQQKFVQNPFIHGSQERLYKTGDLAKYLPDGNIEFLGRNDLQVKIHGYRIELSEIESLLLEQPEIHSVCVTTHKGKLDQHFLVAYIVMKEHDIKNKNYISPKENAFREILAKFIPAYMIPSKFIFIDKLPLTSNGKVDYKALPIPEPIGHINSGDYIAPETEMEKKLSLIWAKLFQREQVGVYENFFELGGDSILSIQLVSKSRQYGIEFNIKELFSNPTIAELAKIVRYNQHKVTRPPLEEPFTGEIILTPVQHWFFELSLNQINYFNQAFILHIKNNLSPEYLKTIFSYLIEYHDALRLRFKYKGNQWVQECLETETTVNVLAFEVVDLTSFPLDNQTIIKNFINEFQSHLNIEKGPIFKIALFQCPAKEQKLLLIIHHLICDGISWRILLEHIETAYLQLEKGESISLPSKTHSYQQWSQILTEYAKSIETSTVDYWLNTICSKLESIPLDFNAMNNNIEDSITISASLDPKLTLQLLQKSSYAYNTQITDILLAALVLSVGNWTGHYNIYLNLEGHGRESIIEYIDLSQTVGWFTTIFPVFLKVSTPEDLGNVLETIKDQLRKIPNKGIDYGILKYLNKNTDLKNAPTPPISFNYLGQWDNVTKQSKLFDSFIDLPDSSVGPKNQRIHILDINCQIMHGSFQTSWTYNKNHYNKETMQNLSADYIRVLKNIIIHCCTQKGSKRKTEEFPLARISQSNLERLFNKYGEEKCKT